MIKNLLQNSKSTNISGKSNIMKNGQTLIGGMSATFSLVILRLTCVAESTRIGIHLVLIGARKLAALIKSIALIILSVLKGKLSN